MIATEDTDILTSPALPGRDYQVSGLGTWDGATVTLQAFVDGEWRDIPDGAWTADFEIVRTNNAAAEIRLVPSETGSGTSLSLTISEVPLA